jgi:ankyrin repeat protein
MVESKFSKADFPKLLEKLRLRAPPDIDNYQMYIEGNNFCIEFTTSKSRAAAWASNASNTEYVATQRDVKDKVVIAKMLDKLRDKPHLINRPNVLGETPLHAALTSNNPELLKEILTNPLLDPNVQNKQGVSGAMLALEKGVLGPTEIQALLEKGDVKAKDKKGNTLLHYACEYSTSAAVDQLITKGADINDLNEARETPIFSVFRNKKPDSDNCTSMVKSLCEKGIDPNYVSTKNRTPLLAAIDAEFMTEDDVVACVNSIINNNTKGMGLLSKQGASSKAAYKTVANSMKSSASSPTIITPTVLPVDLNLITEYITPLSFAAYKDYVKVIELLLKGGFQVKGANINLQSSLGYSALMYAAAFGKVKAANALIAKGADKTFESKLTKSISSTGRTFVPIANEKGITDGNTALHLAAKGVPCDGEGKPFSLDVYTRTISTMTTISMPVPTDEERLISGTCNPYDAKEIMNLVGPGNPIEWITKTNLVGRNPFHYACQRGYLDIVKAFLDKDDASTHVILKSGTTSELPLAFKNHLTSAGKLLTNLHTGMSESDYKKYVEYIKENIIVEKELNTQRKNIPEMNGLMVAAAYEQWPVMAYLSSDLYKDIEGHILKNIRYAVDSQESVEDGYGNTYVHHAIMTNNIPKEYEANISNPVLADFDNHMGYVPLHVAIMKNNEAIIKALIDAEPDIVQYPVVLKSDGIKVDTSKAAITPMKLAVLALRPNAVLALCKKGVSDEGMTPIIDEIEANIVKYDTKGVIPRPLAAEVRKNLSNCDAAGDLDNEEMIDTALTLARAYTVAKAHEDSIKEGALAAVNASAGGTAAAAVATLTTMLATAVASGAPTTDIELQLIKAQKQLVEIQSAYAIREIQAILGALTRVARETEIAIMPHQDNIAEIEIERVRVEGATTIAIYNTKDIIDKLTNIARAAQYSISLEDPFIFDKLVHQTENAVHAIERIVTRLMIVAKETQIDILKNMPMTAEIDDEINRLKAELEKVKVISNTKDAIYAMANIIAAIKHKAMVHESRLKDAVIDKYIADIGVLKQTIIGLEQIIRLRDEEIIGLRNIIRNIGNLVGQIQGATPAGAQAVNDRYDLVSAQLMRMMDRMFDMQNQATNRNMDRLAVAIEELGRRTAPAPSTQPQAVVVQQANAETDAMLRSLAGAVNALQQNGDATRRELEGLRQNIGAQPAIPPQLADYLRNRDAEIAGLFDQMAQQTAGLQQRIANIGRPETAANILQGAIQSIDARIAQAGRGSNPQGVPGYLAGTAASAGRQQPLVAGRPIGLRPPFSASGNPGITNRVTTPEGYAETVALQAGLNRPISQRFGLIPGS